MSAPGERWSRVKALLQDALERPAGERAAFLGAADVGADTREEVAALLRAHDESPAYLDRSAGELAGLAGTDDAEAMIGARVGPYLLLRLLGRGGMGAVYLAERADGFHRQVALKLIARSLPSDAVVRRFEREREILARLDHPHIAALYDGGTGADGRPYLVMKLVEGEPIDAYCVRHHLGVEERLRLFLAVCDAVQYAHQNLVVHRDLKPANVLVTGEGEPMLLDFGIAKLLDAEPGEGNRAAAAPTELTVFGRPLTPEYASPEQLRGEPVTTASDVYGLGVVLFQLLTRTLPHRYNGNPVALLRELEEGALPRPSTAATASEGADDRRALRRRLRGDLDTIVSRALHPEPARRYASVEAFGDDLRRHLGGLPVRARTDTLGYRAGKFVGRHRVGVAVAAVVAVLLVASTTMAVVQAARAQRRFDEVRALAHSFLFEFHDAIADLPGATPARELLVKRALEYLDRLSREAAGDESLLAELRDAYRKVGDVQGMPRAQSLGHSAEALQSYGKALAIAKRLSAAHPRDGAAMLAVADVEDRIADVESMQGQMSVALARQRRALDTVQAAWERDHYAPARRQWILERVALSDVLYEAGRRDEAVAGYRAALAATERRVRDEPRNREPRRHVGVIEQRLGDAAREMGHWDEEIVHDRASLAVDEELAKGSPASAETQRDLATDHTRLGLARRNAGDPAGGLEEQRTALALRQKLLAADPADSRARADAAESWSQIAQAQGDLQDHAAALASWRACLALRRAQQANDPANAHWNDELASDLEQSALAQLAAGDRTGGLAALHEAVALRERIARAAPDFFDNRVHGARLAATMARVLVSRTGEPGTEACGWWERSLREYAALRKSPGLSGDDADGAAAAARDGARCTGAVLASAHR